MQKINDLFKLAEEGVPFALARFNDGEMKGVRSAGITVARGDQPVDASLHTALVNAIDHRQENYWIGVPCRRCFPQLRELADQRVPKDYPYRTLAVVQTNRNLKQWKDEFHEKIKGRDVVWISGDDQGLSKVDRLFRIIRHIKLPTKDAWRQYENLMLDVDPFQPGEVVMMSCGPLATVLAHKFFERQPWVTFIDIGSVYDPETRGVRHRCHTGKLPSCRECN